MPRPLTKMPSGPNQKFPMKRILVFVYLCVRICITAIPTRCIVPQCISCGPIKPVVSHETHRRSNQTGLDPDQVSSIWQTQSEWWQNQTVDDVDDDIYTVVDMPGVARLLLGGLWQALSNVQETGRVALVGTLLLHYKYINNNERDHIVGQLILGNWSSSIVGL